MERFLAFRKHVFEELKKYFENDEDGHHKSYEGAMSISFNYPDYFIAGNEHEIDDILLTLDCYVIGPSRHYQWRGKTFDEVVSKAWVEFDSWLAEK